MRTVKWPKRTPGAVLEPGAPHTRHVSHRSLLLRVHVVSWDFFSVLVFPQTASHISLEMNLFYFILFYFKESCHHPGEKKKKKNTERAFKRKWNSEFPRDWRLPLHNTIAFPRLWRTDTAAPLGTCGIDKQLVAEMGLIFDLTAVARHGSCSESRKKHPVSEDDRAPPPAASATCCFLFSWEQGLQILSPERCPALVPSHPRTALPAPSRIQAR